MTEEEDRRLRDVENSCTQFRAHWEEQGRSNVTNSKKHEAHFRHIKEIANAIGECLTEADMTTIEHKVDDLKDDMAQRKGAEKTWRLIGGCLGLVLVILQIWMIVH